MKPSTILCFICLVILGTTVALRVNAPPHQAATAPIVDPQPAPPIISTAEDVPAPTVAQSPAAAQTRELLQKLAAQQAEYERVREGALRSREEWKKRWAADTAAFSAELAAAAQSVAAETQARKEAEARLQEIEARLRESIAAAKAAAEQEKRERAEQAAASPPAPQQASDF